MINWFIEHVICRQKKLTTLVKKSGHEFMTHLTVSLCVCLAVSLFDCCEVFTCVFFSFDIYGKVHVVCMCLLSDDRKLPIEITHLCGIPVWAAAAPAEGCSPQRSFFYRVWFQSVSADLPESAPHGLPERAAVQLIQTLLLPKHRTTHT